MKRLDRLFQLSQILRDGAWHRARDLAAATQVTERTIWRDMELLAGSGLPIEGTRGLGYRLTQTIPLPPVQLTALELEALRLGLSVVADEADPELQGAARALLGKFDAALPGHGVRARPQSGLGRAPFARAAMGFAHMPLLRRAIDQMLVLALDYDMPGHEPFQSLVRPLRMDYLGGFWSLTAWSEARQDFEVFQVDRIRSLAETGQDFQPEPGKRIDDYHARFAGGPHGN